MGKLADLQKTDAYKKVKPAQMPTPRKRQLGKAPSRVRPYMDDSELEAIDLGRKNRDKVEVCETRKEAKTHKDLPSNDQREMISSQHKGPAKGKGRVGRPKVVSIKSASQRRNESRKVKPISHEDDLPPVKKKIWNIIANKAYGHGEREGDWLSVKLSKKELLIEGMARTTLSNHLYSMRDEYRAFIFSAKNGHTGYRIFKIPFNLWASSALGKLKAFSK